MTPEELAAASTVWVPRSWGGWIVDGSSQSFTDHDEALRPYALWRFAEELSAQGSIDDVALGTVLQRLWNAVDSRLRFIHSLYDLRAVTRLSGRSTKKLDRLEVLMRLELARPAVLQRLKELRNAVEHEDVPPPPLEDCRMFVDFVWYFLRSTDHLVVSVLNDMELIPHDRADGEPFVELAFEPPAWKMRLRGWFDPHDLGSSPDHHRLEVELVKPAEIVDGKGVFVSGSLKPTPEQFEPLLADYFSVLALGQEIRTR